mmetsp:Transcript_7918/g.23863  ORF Transcript_7918/g.23863 Transcript_7918/m.23863 type:complete len:254 (-) Transcript_7918:1400-2161(-)
MVQRMPAAAGPQPARHHVLQHPRELIARVQLREQVDNDGVVHSARHRVRPQHVERQDGAPDVERLLPRRQADGLNGAHRGLAVVLGVRCAVQPWQSVARHVPGREEEVVEHQRQQDLSREPRCAGRLGGEHPPREDAVICKQREHVDCGLAGEPLPALPAPRAHVVAGADWRAPRRRQAFQRHVEQKEQPDAQRKHGHHECRFKRLVAHPRGRPHHVPRALHRRVGARGLQPHPRCQRDGRATARVRCGGDTH